MHTGARVKTNGMEGRIDAPRCNKKKGEKKKRVRKAPPHVRRRRCRFSALPTCSYTANATYCPPRRGSSLFFCIFHLTLPYLPILAGLPPCPLFACVLYFCCHCGGFCPSYLLPLLPTYLWTVRAVEHLGTGSLEIVEDS